MSTATILAQESEPGFTDNEVLDQFTVPFGEWIEQMVRWIDQNAQSVLAVIEWPFNKLFIWFVDGPNHHPFWEITDMPWWAIVLITFLIGSFVRNVRVGIGTASALAVCGLLGVEYWDEVSVTIGMILVSVVLCALVGIPIGVACGRVDAVWASVRPALDAMQVVHSFVYMLPVIFFFGIGKTSATMVTMVFAIPPLIRLTNLGIRSVPEDVVEAARSYGAPESRVLLDVQLPLARPAIMTGLNQTLLLSISMLGIAAIMGAGGLGSLVFRGVQNLDINLSASAGLALFLVAVVLDRISQTQDDDGASLGKRIRAAWSHRSDPEALLAPTDANVAEAPETASGFAPLTSSEQLGSKIALGAGAAMFFSAFLTWSSDGGVITSYARAIDIDLTGQNFSGWSSEGGSWFAIFVAIAGLFLVGCALWTLRSPSSGGSKIGPDGAMIASIAGFGSALAFLVASPIEGSPASSGIGVWLAVVAS
ncbi:MAG: ABC transporter permease subunit, partial [Actinobacteria bacterium]|nr:ABC transporter permease subunit [Actinomycetota bacterium]